VCDAPNPQVTFHRESVSYRLYAYCLAVPARRKLVDEEAPVEPLAPREARTSFVRLTAGVRLAGRHVLERVGWWPTAVADRNHRFAAVAVGGNGNLGRVAAAGDGAHIVSVRPVARQRGDRREIARSGLVEPLDRPTVDAGILLVGFGLVVAGGYEDAGRGDARYTKDEGNPKRHNTTSHSSLLNLLAEHR